MNSREIPKARLALEGFVVVVSILMAFALDALWTQRDDARTATAHMRALQSDFQQNIMRLEALIARQDAIADASRRLLYVASSPGIASPEDSLRNLLGRVFTSDRFDPIMGAYEAIVSSGGLAQVPDDSLRLALADFASLVERNYSERYSDEVYFDFVRNYTGQLGFAEAVLADSGAGASAVADFGYNRRLLLDMKFREHLALRYLAERDVAASYRGLLAKAQRALTLTERALKDDDRK